MPFHVLVNPTLTVRTDEVVAAFEGCLSFAGFSMVVPRARKVRVEALDENGQRVVKVATGWYARILQHEVDHLHGIVCCDRMESRTLTTNENFSKHWQAQIGRRGARRGHARRRVATRICSARALAHRASGCAPSARRLRIVELAATATVIAATGTRSRLDLNRATIKELEALPGIGPVKARSIMASRNARGGRFNSLDELIAIDGVGEKTVEAIRPYVEVGP